MYLKLKVVNDLSKLVIIGSDQAYSVPFSGETYLVYLLGEKGQEDALQALSALAEDVLSQVREQLED